MILFTGCSMTWGDELEHRLQDRFSKSHPNIAECGMSNDMMVMKTIEFIDKTPRIDFVVAQFTVPRRVMYYQDEWKNLTPWTKNTEARVFYKYLDSQEMRMMNLWKNVYILDRYLQNIPHYFWRSGEESEKEVKNDCIFRKLSPWSDMVTLYDLIGTPDGSPENYVTGHPNKKGHELISQHLQGVVPNSLYH